MEKQPKQTLELAKKRKRKSNLKIKASEPKNKKLDKVTPVEETKIVTPVVKKDTATQKTPLPKVMYEGMTMEEISIKYPILQNKELVERFLKVPFNNNQRGRIKQAITLQLKSSNNRLNPDAINGKIQAILKTSNDLTDSELRRVRILYNMLNRTLTNPQQNDEEETKVEKPKKNKKKTAVKKEKEVTEDEPVEKEVKKEQPEQKVKGPKRYVAFVGNLPLGITEEEIMDHFSEFRDRITSVRIPKSIEEKKSAIAFIELSDEPTYELALSKHHTMLKNKRINVLYSKQKNSKITEAEAKSKSAKLIALQKSGKLLGSVPLEKKRSQRRLKLKKAQAKQAAASA